MTPDRSSGEPTDQPTGLKGSKLPTILYKEKADYTDLARRNEMQGVVVLNVIFEAEGTISNIRVVRGLPDGLNDQAIAAARKIRFTPAMKGGQSVSVRLVSAAAHNE